MKESYNDLGWRKMLLMRNHIRDHVWYDNWSRLGTLDGFWTKRQNYDQGYSLKTSLADIVIMENGHIQLPSILIQQVSMISNLDRITLTQDCLDTTQTTDSSTNVIEAKEQLCKQIVEVVHIKLICSKFKPSKQTKKMFLVWKLHERSLAQVME
ncbi:hypothetical protein Tco_0573987 [Tanacetum coccineum]